jgi:predicted nucleic acid-binding protein
VKIVVDTYAWIEMLIGSEKGIKAKEIIENAEEVFTPSIVLAETARKFLREGIEENTISKWLEIISHSSIIAQIDLPTALEAAKCHLMLAQKAKIEKLNTPSLFDAIIYATAITNSCKIVTGDEHLKDLPETCWIS